MYICIFIYSNLFTVLFVHYAQFAQQQLYISIVVIIIVVIIVDVSIMYIVLFRGYIVSCICIVFIVYTYYERPK